MGLFQVLQVLGLPLFHFPSNLACSALCRIQSFVPIAAKWLASETDEEEEEDDDDDDLYWIYLKQL